MGGETLTDDVFEYLAGFMAPADLLATAQVNSYWRAISARDSIWRRLCVLRWLLRRPERLKRTTGTESFMELYRYLDRNRYLPQEKYSAKQVIWGKSRQESADAWVTVVHTPDCRTPSHRGKPFIQLRVVLQNLHAQAMNIELHDVQVRFKNGDSAKILGVGAAEYNLQAQTLAPSLVAINGVDVLPAASHRPVELRMFDIATLSVNVECEGCEFETDFLESCSTVWVPIRRMGKCKSLAQCRCGLIPDSYHRGSIRVPIVDEAVVWKHYTLISGRFMVFDSRNSQDLLLFDPPFKSHSPSRSRRKCSIS